MIKICKACGTSYNEDIPLIERCKICEDERQFVPVTGQQWIDLSSLTDSHSNKWKKHQDRLFSIKTVPNFAINQRAFLLQTDEGNILWDCVANLDDATKALITAMGGLSAIAISHPHYYTTMQDWADYFNAPLFLHARDSEWIVRNSPALHLWDGDKLNLNQTVTLVRLGGHFAGGNVLHWAQQDGVVLAGDIIQVTPGANAVSFMWSYPNMLPLSAGKVGELINHIDSLKFDRLYGAFEGQNITSKAKDIVMRSGQKYIDCL